MVWWWLLLKKALLMGSHFHSKQCREHFVTTLSCFSQSLCNALEFRTPFFLRLLLELYTYEGLVPLGVFPLYLKMAVDIIAPKLTIIFRGLIRLGSFLGC